MKMHYGELLLAVSVVVASSAASGASAFVVKQQASGHRAAPANVGSSEKKRLPPAGDSSSSTARTSTIGNSAVTGERRRNSVGDRYYDSVPWDNRRRGRDRWHRDSRSYSPYDSDRRREYWRDNGYSYDEPYYPDDSRDMVDRRENTYGHYRATRNGHQSDMLWDANRQEHVQGDSLKTWAFAGSSPERIQVVLKTDGRPLDADVELWQGPDHIPVKIRAYVEDGSLRPLSVVIATPRGSNTIAVRNIGQIEFPMSACVVGEGSRPGPVAVAQPTTDYRSETIQGGALRTYPFDPIVESVQVMLKTDGRPLQARVELMHGPNNYKQVVEIDAEDGMENPVFLVLETPGNGHVVRVANTAPIEFPITAWVDAYMVGDSDRYTEPVVMGDSRGSMYGRRYSW